MARVVSHVTPVAHYLPGRELVVGPHHLEVILGVEIGRELGRADQVAEERRELPPLVGVFAA